MAFVTGLLLIDASASALNNLGSIAGEREENTVGVKHIRVYGDGDYPYASAQAFRYWLRTTLETRFPAWVASPMYREEKIAYTDANPMQWWDDDLFGYMRAPSKKESAKVKREADPTLAQATETTDTITRVSPFRVGTLVSMNPVKIVSDFGTMSRHEGNPVPHEHQFYRATLKGLWSLDLRAAGTFSYRNKTGFRNLDSVREQLAKQQKLEHLEHAKSYRLPLEVRQQRVKTLFEGMAHLEGGAKQTLHYTDVAPVLTIFAVTKGGNHIFNHVVTTTDRGKPTINTAALDEALRVFADELLSPVYVGWVRGYNDQERQAFEAYLANSTAPIQLSHPREAFLNFAESILAAENHQWME